MTVLWVHRSRLCNVRGRVRMVQAPRRSARGARVVGREKRDISSRQSARTESSLPRATRTRTRTRASHHCVFPFFPSPHLFHPRHTRRHFCTSDFFCRCTTLCFSDFLARGYRYICKFPFVVEQSSIGRFFCVNLSFGRSTVSFDSRDF